MIRQKLISLLRQAEAMLAEQGEGTWQVRVHTVRKQDACGDGNCVAAFPSLLRGMGSLNDRRLADRRAQEGLTLVLSPAYGVAEKQRG